MIASRPSGFVRLAWESFARMAPTFASQGPFLDPYRAIMGHGVIQPVLVVVRVRGDGLPDAGVA
jgi:hypothetical protein